MDKEKKNNVTLTIALTLYVYASYSLVAREVADYKADIK